MREPGDRGDYLQDLLSRRTAAVRYAGRRLRTGGSKSRGENTTYPQSPTSELHETAGYPDWVTHQLPRDETDRRRASPYPSRREPMNFVVQQEKTEGTETQTEISVCSVSSCSSSENHHINPAPMND